MDSVAAAHQTDAMERGFCHSHRFAGQYYRIALLHLRKVLVPPLLCFSPGGTNGCNPARLVDSKADITQKKNCNTINIHSYRFLSPGAAHQRSTHIRVPVPPQGVYHI